MNNGANTLLATIPVGNAPTNVAVNPLTNRIVVSHEFETTQTLIDGATNTVVGLPLAAMQEPGALDFNTRTNRTYVIATVNTGGPVGYVLRMVMRGPTYSVKVNGADVTKVLPGTTVQVSWDGLFGTSPADQVALFQQGGGPPITASFLNGTGSPGGNGRPSGTVGLPIRAELPAGTYEVRLRSGHAGQTLGSLALKVLGTPVANADPSYSVAAGSTLTVPVGSGVLANDADADNLATLQAQVVNQPASGTLNLQPDGSFTYTPAANVNGPVTFTYQAKDADNLQPDAATVTITITGQRPAAVNDGPYAVTSGIDLAVSAADGLLKNDADADTASSALTVAALTQPTGGTISLHPSGAFMYNPRPGFSGPDSFTYRVTDNQGLISNVATASLTVNAVANPVIPPTTCGPRPTVVVRTEVVGGALQATVTATDTNALNNRLQSIAFGALQNAQVTLNGAAITDGQVVTLPAGTTTQTFTVRRAAAGQPTTVPLTVTDACGSWPTFVGGGTGAGF